MGQSDYDYLLDVTKRYHNGEISSERYKEVWDMIMRWKREEQGGELVQDWIPWLKGSGMCWYVRDI